MSPTSLSTLGLAALTYAQRFGLAVFPCQPRAKAPLTEHGCKDATLDLERISEWWTRFPDANVGIACGEISRGLVVLDVDGEDGAAWVRDREREHGAIETSGTITGKGSQLWFTSEGSFRNRVRLAPGIDLRTSGGYTIAPPSVHPNGRTYAWEVSSRIDDIGIRPMPEWLEAILLPSAQEKDRSPLPSSFWSEIAKGVGAGRRNDSLARIAGHLLRRHVDPVLALGLLRAWSACCNPPLSDNEVFRSFDSICVLEAKRREARIAG